MEIKRRTIHPEQRSSNWQLLNEQRRLLSEQWSNDVEIYDDQGDLIAITSRNNPRLSEVLAQLELSAPRDNS